MRREVIVRGELKVKSEYFCVRVRWIAVESVCMVGEGVRWDWHPGDDSPFRLVALSSHTGLRMSV